MPMIAICKFFDDVDSVYPRHHMLVKSDFRLSTSAAHPERPAQCGGAEKHTLPSPSRPSRQVLTASGPHRTENVTHCRVQSVRCRNSIAGTIHYKSSCSVLGQGPLFEFGQIRQRCGAVVKNEDPQTGSRYCCKQFGSCRHHAVWIVPRLDHRLVAHVRQCQDTGIGGIHMLLADRRNAG